MNSQTQPQPAIPSYNMLPLFKTSKWLFFLTTRDTGMYPKIFRSSFC